MTKNKQEDKPKKASKPVFKQGDQVFFTAFLKQDKQKFYLCRGILEKCPGKQERQLFKVKIIGVANKPVGGKESFDQSSLLGRVITKKFKELHKDVPFFMKPSAWIEVTSAK